MAEEEKEEGEIDETVSKVSERHSLILTFQMAHQSAKDASSCIINLRNTYCSFDLIF